MKKIAIFEDDNDFRETFKGILESRKYEVPIIAGSLKEACELIPKMKDMAIDVALVDGNLTKNDISGYDGKIVSDLIRQISPNTVVICCSGQKYDWGDAHISKSDVGIKGTKYLLEVIETARQKEETPSS